MQRINVWHLYSWPAGFCWSFCSHACSLNLQKTSGWLNLVNLTCRRKTLSTYLSLSGNICAIMFPMAPLAYPTALNDTTGLLIKLIFCWCCVRLTRTLSQVLTIIFFSLLLSNFRFYTMQKGKHTFKSLRDVKYVKCCLLWLIVVSWVMHV